MRRCRWVLRGRESRRPSARVSRHRFIANALGWRRGRTLDRRRRTVALPSDRIHSEPQWLRLPTAPLAGCDVWLMHGHDQPGTCLGRTDDRGRVVVTADQRRALVERAVRRRSSWNSSPSCPVGGAAASARRTSTPRRWRWLRTERLPDRPPGTRRAAQRLPRPLPSARERSGGTRRERRRCGWKARKRSTHAWLQNCAADQRAPPAAWHINSAIRPCDSDSAWKHSATRWTSYSRACLPTRRTSGGEPRISAR